MSSMCMTSILHALSMRHLQVAASNQGKSTWLCDIECLRLRPARVSSAGHSYFRNVATARVPRKYFSFELQNEYVATLPPQLREDEME